MQAASSSGDYDAPADGGLMDLDALADLPPFDEALIPEAMGILGFDMADLPGGAKEAPDDAFDDAQGAKKPKVPGGNQREVQKRYRERKKNYTKDLEAKVQTLETQLKELRGAKQRANEDEVLTHMALGRVVPNKGGLGFCSRGAGATEDDDSAYSTIDSKTEKAGAKNVNIGECPLEHRKFSDAFRAKMDDLRALLDAGASDAALLGALRDTLKFCAPRNAMGMDDGPFNVTYQLILNKHAAALNAENEGLAPLASKTSGKKTPGKKTSVSSPNSRDALAGACVGSVCGGPLRTVALDGTMMSENDVAASVSAACDALLMQTPPIEVQKLVDWRDDYMRDLREVYFERQKLGLQLAAAGGAIVATGPAPGPAKTKNVAAAPGANAASVQNERSASGSDDSHETGVRDGGGAVATVTLAMGSAARVDDETRKPSGVGDASAFVPSIPTSSHAGAKMLDVLAVVELLKRSVQREMGMKCERTVELVTQTLSPRTAAHLACSMIPAMPDPLAIATEAKARGFAGMKGGSAVKA